MSFAVALPGLLGFLLTRWLPWQSEWWPAISTMIVLATLWLAFRLRQMVVYPLYTLSNLMEALREGDFSLRGARARQSDAIGDVVWEVNALSETLRRQRLRVEETLNLLSKVMSEIDIAVLTFDQHQQLRLVNAAGARLLGDDADALIGRSVDSLGLQACLEIVHEATLERSFPGASGRFGIRHVTFRQDGVPHELLVISDLSKALRQEERQAWQRLIRVLGHELNNSLAPIRSLAETLGGLMDRKPFTEDVATDMRAGLLLIRDRATSLSRFMMGYAALARLPAPVRKKVSLQAMVARVALWEQRVPVVVRAGPDMSLQVDADQIEQALINLLKNAAESMLALPNADVEAEAVMMDWAIVGRDVLIRIADRGTGLASSDNLFVPFFTTKPAGSGVGLALARQIAEAHGGQLNLENRSDGQGCLATLRLPLARSGSLSAE